jgi:hypothetical protein
MARTARSVRVDDSIGRWLYGVSVRVAGRAGARGPSEVASRVSGNSTEPGKPSRRLVASATSCVR